MTEDKQLIEQQIIKYLGIQKYISRKKQIDKWLWSPAPLIIPMIIWHKWTYSQKFPWPWWWRNKLRGDGI